MDLAARNFLRLWRKRLFVNVNTELIVVGRRKAKKVQICEFKRSLIKFLIYATLNQFMLVIFKHKTKLASPINRIRT